MASETRNTQQIAIGQSESTVPAQIFSEYKPASFTVAGRSYAFPILSIDESGGNRLIERERPYRNGAKLDDTGSKAKRWNFEAFFENSISDAGLSEINEGRPLYPDVLNSILEIFDIHQTGDLMIPTRGMRRVRAESYSRRESFEARDASALRLTFIEDNEDNVDASSIQAPSANANARRSAETTTFTTQQSGGWHSSLMSLDELTSGLEGLMNAPGDYGQSIRVTSGKIQGSAVRAKQAFQRSGKTGRDLFLDPTNSRAERKLVQHQEIAARAANDSRKGRPPVIQVVFRERTSLFRISVIVNQSFEDLAGVNPTIDPLNIPAMTPVNVFALEELFNAQRTSS